MCRGSEKAGQKPSVLEHPRELIRVVVVGWKETEDCDLCCYVLLLNLMPKAEQEGWTRHPDGSFVGS